jgi:hypothetical protein
MRIRSTKPEFWRSKTIAALPWDVRLVLKGLESYVDDNGVGKDDIALIAADVFPRDLSGNPRDTLARLSEAISALHDGGLIARYVADGEDLLYIGRWKELQRIDKPGRGRFPRPDGTLEYGEPVDEASYRVIRETVARPPERVAPGTGEQGNRGTGEQNTPAPAVLESAFERAWSHWPKKVERKSALAKFKAATKRLDVEELVEAIIRFGAAYAATTDRQFVPALDAWLNGDRWNDELPQPRSQQQQPSAAQRAASLVGTFGAPQQPALEEPWT